MTAAQYLQAGDWVTNPTLATVGQVLTLTAPPEPLGQSMLLLHVRNVGTGVEGTFTVHRDDDYLTLGPENLARRRAVELDLQRRLRAELVESVRVVEGIDARIAGILATAGGQDGAIVQLPEEASA